MRRANNTASTFLSASGSNSRYARTTARYAWASCPRLSMVDRLGHTHKEYRRRLIIAILYHLCHITAGWKRAPLRPCATALPASFALGSCAKHRCNEQQRKATHIVLHKFVIGFDPYLVCDEMHAAAHGGLEPQRLRIVLTMLLMPSGIYLPNPNGRSHESVAMGGGRSQQCTRIWIRTQVFMLPSCVHTPTPYEKRGGNIRFS